MSVPLLLRGYVALATAQRQDSFDFSNFSPFSSQPLQPLDFNTAEWHLVTTHTVYLSRQVMLDRSRQSIHSPSTNACAVQKACFSWRSGRWSGWRSKCSVQSDVHTPCWSCAASPSLQPRNPAECTVSVPHVSAAVSLSVQPWSAVYPRSCAA